PPPLDPHSFPTRRSSDLLAADTLRLTLELARPLVQRAHDSVADADEILHEVELRLAARGEVDLVGIRDLDRALPDLKLHERRRQDRKSTRLNSSHQIISY